MRGVEPPRPCEHYHLKVACIPFHHIRIFPFCAQEESRTPTPLRALAPEASASAIPPLGQYLALLAPDVNLILSNLRKLDNVMKFCEYKATSMKKVLLTTSFLFMVPFAFIFGLIIVLSIYNTRTANYHFAASGKSVAYAALPTSQNSLSADIQVEDGRAERIRQFLARYGSPIEPYAADFVKAADQYHLDYRLVVAIAMKESTLCQKIPHNSYNCWGFGVYGDQVIRFADYKEGIYTVSKALGTRYKEKHGLVEPEQIMTMYTPSSDGSWARGVRFVMGQLE